MKSKHTTMADTPDAPHIINPSSLPSLDMVDEELERRRRNKLYTMFPDTGTYRRSLYKKHTQFFAAGAIHNERLFLAANRIGKTVAGSVELTYHATGLYPSWWEGKRFKEPIMGWACNKTANDCRDINQLELLGSPGYFGTGMIPSDLIIQTKPRPSVPDAVMFIYVRHVTGGQSTLALKSYDQGREGFQGRAVHAIWLDEEVPEEIYTECLLRLATTDGIIYCTYTPIMGLTRVTVDFLRNSVNKDSLPIKFSDRDINKQGM